MPYPDRGTQVESGKRALPPGASATSVGPFRLIFNQVRRFREQEAAATELGPDRDRVPGLGDDRDPMTEPS
jgi:hypothetical protein